MERIIYISTCRTDPDRDLVESILAVSRRNNQRAGLTGLLVIGGRRFLQVLEGPNHAVEDVYRRIRADKRHFAMVQLTRKPITERSFPDWNMGCEQLDGADLSELVEQLTRDLDADVQAQFRSFVELHRAAA